MTDDIMSDDVMDYDVIIKMVKVSCRFLKKGSPFDYVQPSIDSREAFSSKCCKNAEKS